MTHPIEPIRGKVARVLNEREVALNKGLVDGVEVGMVFRILSPKGSTITDPDTNEPLGTVELEKTRVKVTSIQDRVSVASTYRESRINVGGTGTGLFSTSLFTPPKWETRVETLRTLEAASEELDAEDTYVSRGDPVVQNVETEEVLAF